MFTCIVCSVLLKAWIGFLEMSEAIQKQLSNGAAQMSGVLLHAVDNLIKDKRGAKTVSTGRWRQWEEFVCT